MKFKSWLSALLALFLITSCGIVYGNDQTGNEVEQAAQRAKEAVAAQLRDPESARFRSVAIYQRIDRHGQSHTIVCGEVNGKNVYGGYVGYTEFYVIDKTPKILNRTADRQLQGLFLHLRRQLCSNADLRQ